MKKNYFKSICVFTIFGLSSGLLMSHTPVQKKQMHSDNFYKIEIKDLADMIFNDPTYRLIYKKDIQNTVFQISNQSLLDKDKLASISKRSKFSDNEVDYVIHNVFGFKDKNDFIDYLGLYAHLIKKYDLNTLNEREKKYLFSTLRDRNIKYTGYLEKLSQDHFKRDSLNKFYSALGGIRPECWKCVYDYQACLYPVIGNSKTVTIEVPTINSVRLNITDGAGSVLWSVSYFTINFPGTNEVTYTAPSIQSSPCNYIYKTCMAQCDESKIN